MKLKGSPGQIRTAVSGFLQPHFIAGVRGHEVSEPARSTKNLWFFVRKGTAVPLRRHRLNRANTKRGCVETHTQHNEGWTRRSPSLCVRAQSASRFCGCQRPESLAARRRGYSAKVCAVRSLKYEVRSKTSNL